MAIMLFQLMLSIFLLLVQVYATHSAAYYFNNLKLVRENANNLYEEFLARNEINYTKGIARYLSSINKSLENLEISKDSKISQEQINTFNHFIEGRLGNAEVLKKFENTKSLIDWYKLEDRFEILNILISNKENSNNFITQLYCIMIKMADESQIPVQPIHDMFQGITLLKQDDRPKLQETFKAVFSSILAYIHTDLSSQAFRKLLILTADLNILLILSSINFNYNNIFEGKNITISFFDLDTVEKEILGMGTQFDENLKKKEILMLQSKDVQCSDLLDILNKFILQSYIISLFPMFGSRFIKALQYKDQCESFQNSTITSESNTLDLIYKYYPPAISFKFSLCGGISDNMEEELLSKTTFENYQTQKNIDIDIETFKQVNINEKFDEEDFKFDKKTEDAFCDEIKIMKSHLENFAAQEKKRLSFPKLVFENILIDYIKIFYTSEIDKAIQNIINLYSNYIKTIKATHIKLSPPPSNILYWLSTNTKNLFATNSDVDRPLKDFLFGVIESSAKIGQKDLSTKKVLALCDLINHLKAFNQLHRLFFNLQKMKDNQPLEQSDFSQETVKFFVLSKYSEAYKLKMKQDIAKISPKNPKIENLIKSEKIEEQSLFKKVNEALQALKDSNYKSELVFYRTEKIKQNIDSYEKLVDTFPVTGLLENIISSLGNDARHLSNINPISSEISASDLIISFHMIRIQHLMINMLLVFINEHAIACECIGNSISEYINETRNLYFKNPQILLYEKRLDILINNVMIKKRTIEKLNQNLESINNSEINSLRNNYTNFGVSRLQMREAYISVVENYLSFFQMIFTKLKVKETDYEKNMENFEGNYRSLIESLDNQEPFLAYNEKIVNFIKEIESITFSEYFTIKIFLDILIVGPENFITKSLLEKDDPEVKSILSNVENTQKMFEQSSGFEMKHNSAVKRINEQKLEIFEKYPNVKQEFEPKESIYPDITIYKSIEGLENYNLYCSKKRELKSIIKILNLISQSSNIKKYKDSGYTWKKYISKIEKMKLAGKKIRNLNLLMLNFVFIAINTILAIVLIIKMKQASSNQIENPEIYKDIEMIEGE